ncbi:MAG: ABC transporter ATP-binding protein [Acetobacteraceae bacterium]|nr:ABC transporter ATP-binding protein [Acetobacteraceae bacterium]
MTQPAAQPVLSVRDLHVRFGALEAVRGISFDVFPDEVVCVVGESGSGKTVAALAISALLPPNAVAIGSVRLAGTEVVGADAETMRGLRGREIGFIFQDPTTTLNPVLPVGRQIAEGQVAHRQITASEGRARAIELLRQCDIPDPVRRASQYPHQFSGGMRQRAVIAMALAGRPRLIVADEPTTALDVTVQAQILAMLARKQAETRAAALLITHDLGVVAETAHRVLVMYAGRIVEAGPVDQIFARATHPYTRALLRSMPRLDGARRRLDPIPGQPPTPALLPPGCAFHPRCAIGRDRTACRTADPALRPVTHTQFAACHFADERERIRVETAHRPRAGGIGEELLEVQRLTVHYPLRSPILRRRVGAVRAVDGVDLAVRAGETVGLVGESGCGKTTTGRAIMGLIRPSAGQLRVQGRDVAGLSRRALRPVRRHVQYVFQDPYSSLNPALTVGEIIAEPMRIHGLYAELGGARRVATLLDLVGLPRAAAGRYAREFSGGQKQRIGIARALALRPQLLILDEPVAALDVSIQAQVVNLLQDLQAELGLAYLFIAHDLSVVRHISDRVAVMYLGRIVEESDTETLYSRPAHPYTQSLLSAVPIADPAARGRRRRIVLEGEIPNPADPPPGCPFHPRCFRASERCRAEMPPFQRYEEGPTRLACFHPGPPALAATRPQPEGALS